MTAMASLLARTEEGEEGCLRVHRGVEGRRGAAGERRDPRSTTRVAAARGVDPK